MIGTAVVRFRWIALGAWAVAAALLMWLAGAPEPGSGEAASFLPDDAPSSRGVRAMYESFPASSGLSEAAVVFERRGGKLTPADRRAIERVAGKIPRPVTPGISADELGGVVVRSPASIPLPKNPMISEASPRGQGALILVHLPVNFITYRSARIVDHIRAVVAAEEFPEGLAAAVTGSAGFGRDYALAAERSHRRTVWVTLVAVVVILLAVYRAPLAAFVPLVSISLAAMVALRLLAIGEQFGFHTGTAERIFVVVLLYGAGTDYSLLFISRCREYLSAGLAPLQASSAALNATFPAILASAATDAAGMLMLCFADYGIFRTAGPAIAMALGVALATTATLVPALAGVFGAKLFWPGRRANGRAREDLGGRRIWPGIARFVTARPAIVLVATLAALAVPAARGVRLTWIYDTLAGLEDTYDARRGADMARGHWPIGEIAPVTVLLRTDEPRSEAAWRRTVGRLTKALGEIEGVRNVRSLTQPLGSDAGGAAALLTALGRGKVRDEYLSAERRATRVVAVLGVPPLALEAMSAVRQIRRTARAEIDLAGAEVHLIGATPEIADVRAVTQEDFHLIAVLVLGVIFVVIFLLLRDPVLAGFMTCCTVISYLATLGVSYWVFCGLLGAAGLDWKVEVFLFVVIAAVGVDYNIFLAARLAEEARRLPPREAVRQAVAHTGPVISSCGIIMAATLGSLMAGEIVLLHQLGFAFAAGMLIDTFVVRPLLLPAFAALTGRTGGKPLLRKTDAG